MFKKIIFILILPIIGFALSQTKSIIRSETFYLGGIQINEEDQDSLAHLMQSAELNTLHITIYAMQGEWDSDNLVVPTMDSTTLHRIQTAKKNGQKVALVLRIHLDAELERNKFLWHGMVMPKDYSTLRNWFDKYALFVKSWATIAEKEGVDVFAIGSELNALVATKPITSIPGLYAYYNNISKQKQWEKRNYKFKEELKAEDLWVRSRKNKYQNLRNYLNDRIQAHYQWVKQISFGNQKNHLDLMNQRRDTIRQYWKDIITNTRQIYTGKITYAANHDSYTTVDFWKDLDFIGINAYFPLRDANVNTEDSTALLSALKDGWHRVFRQINAFRNRNDLMDKPLIFTELGYIFRDNCTLTPWEGFGFTVIGNGKNQKLMVWAKAPKNYMERKLAIDALYQTVIADDINLEGLLYWKLTMHDYLIKYEPFAMYLSPQADDPLQKSLAQFRQLEKKVGIQEKD